MTELSGKSVFGGIAIGPISIYHKADSVVKREKIEDPESELGRFEKAREEAKVQLQGLYEKALAEVGESNESVQNIVRTQKVNAEFAVATTGDNFAEMFAAMDDEYMQARAADVRDISDRVVGILSGSSGAGFKASVPSILLADDLAPSETVQLDKSMVLSFVTRHGSTNSHTSILARTMGIPALISVDFTDDLEGKQAIVDGITGRFFIDPDEDTMAKYLKLQADEAEKKRLLLELKGKENITLDGKVINVYANIGGVGDVADVLKNDAGGIGLFRSEFLYLESSDYPTEDEQFKAYKTVAENMGGKKVIIRTLDIGADKQVDYFRMEHEENPALGYRAIRICLDRVEIFKTQLRALYRASYYGNIAIMFPMIISVDEVKKIKQIVEEVKASLTAQGIPFGDVELGIMVETPAAVFMSRELAEEVDFFSIGTNDLTQYTLAIDRQNPKLDNINDPHHPAVLRAIETTIKNGHEGGAWVGICGELGADTSLTETFLRMGVDELSVSPSRVLEVRNAIRKTDLSK